MLVCRDAASEIEFCKAAFGAEELARRTGQDGAVMHATLTVGGALIMIHGEYPNLASRAPQSDGSSSVVIYLYVKNVDSVIERAVVAGAKVLLPVTNQFWGDRPTGRDPIQLRQLQPLAALLDWRQQRGGGRRCNPGVALIPAARKERKSDQREVCWWSEGTPKSGSPSLGQERGATRRLACDAAGPHDIGKGMCNKTVRSVLFCYSPPWERTASVENSTGAELGAAFPLKTAAPAGGRGTLQ
jgi:PhnB protein